MFRRTTNHDEIRDWAAARNAVPAEIKPRRFDGEPAILTFLFGEKREGVERVEPMEWDHFFALFDLMGLTLAYDGNNEYQLLQIEAKSPYRFDGKPV